MKGATATPAWAGALAGVALLALVVAGALAPTLRAPPVPDGGHALWGGLEGLTAPGTLVVQAPVQAYTAGEAAQLRRFLEAGGRLLVVEPTPPANSLLTALDVGLSAPGGLVFDPDVDEAGHFTVHASGALGLSDSLVLSRSLVVLGGGEAVLSTGSFAWNDLDASGSPDLGEPRGTWSVARLQAVGNGSVLVLGTAQLLTHAATADAIEAWVAGGGPLWVDARHAAGPDALDAASALAGHRPVAVALLLGAIAAVGAAVAFGLRLQRVRGRRRRGPVDRQTLEILAELSE